MERISFGKLWAEQARITKEVEAIGMLVVGAVAYDDKLSIAIAERIASEHFRTLIPLSLAFGLGNKTLDAVMSHMLLCEEHECLCSKFPVGPRWAKEIPWREETRSRGRRKTVRALPMPSAKS